MSYLQKYRARCVNFEGQTVTINITDLFSPNVNPYSLLYELIGNPGNTDQTILVYFQSQPAGCTGVRIDALDGNGNLLGTSGTITPVTSPVQWITAPLNVSTWLFFFLVPTPGDDEFFVLNELEGVTDEWQLISLRKICNNNTENIFTTVAGLQLVFTVLAPDNNLLNKLLRGTYSDRRYKVVADINDLVFFEGWLQLGDVVEPFLPRPQITFTATDGLGTLKNKTLVDANGNNPVTDNLIIKYIADALRLTGLEKNINIVMNIREEDAGTISDEPDEHFMNTQYLDAKLFEKNIGESEDAYTVLEKIARYLGRFGQRHGEWWFKGFDEYDTQPDYVAVFDSNGDFVEMKDGAYYTKYIGADRDMKWSGERAMVAFSSPGMVAKLRFPYNLPAEIPCNVDFERGDLQSTISANEKRFALDCWDKLWSNTSSDDPATAAIYIRRDYINGYEVKRYVVIEGNSQFTFIMSEGIPVNARDKFIIDVSRRLSSDIGGSGFYRDNSVQVRLYGDDGSYWTHHGRNSADNEIYWESCDSTFRTNQKFFSVEGDLSDDLTEGNQLYDGESAEIPVNGTLKILIYRSSLTGADTRNTHIDRLRFDYLPFINGTHQKYTAQQHSVSQAAGNAESVDDTVAISDSPNRLIKGSLKKYDSVNDRYILSERFWNAAVYPGGVPSPDYYHPFGYIQIFNVWNQVNRLKRILRGSIQGIESGSLDGLNRCDLPTVFHSYYLTDTDEHTVNKKFMLLSYDMDLVNCEWGSAVLKEVHDEAAGKVYNDTHEFKYITR